MNRIHQGDTENVEIVTDYSVLSVSPWCDLKSARSNLTAFSAGVDLKKEPPQCQKGPLDIKSGGPFMERIRVTTIPESDSLKEVPESVGQRC